jgi:hypothetical protein
VNLGDKKFTFFIYFKNPIMKKIKFMLLSLTLVAVIGAALAFKAKFGNVWCITTAKLSANGLYTCTNPVCGTTYANNIASTVNQPLPGLTTFCSTRTNGLSPVQFDICTDAVGVTKNCPNTFNPTADGAGVVQLIPRHS